MTYEDAKISCHVRSAIYVAANPNERFWKNHPVSLDQRVPDELKSRTDWQEHDPREDHFEAYA